jgi:hypothetical protein
LVSVLGKDTGARLERRCRSGLFVVGASILGKKVAAKSRHAGMCCKNECQTMSQAIRIITHNRRIANAADNTAVRMSENQVNMIKIDVSGNV